MQAERTITNFAKEAWAIEHGARCDLCPLAGTQRGPVLPSIPDNVHTLVVAEAPGHTEIAKGEVLIGASGKEIRGALAAAGADMSRVGFTNAAMCAPPEEMKKHIQLCRKMKVPNAIECCKPRLQREIAQASFVILMGGASLTAAGVKDSIMALRGTPVQIPGGPRALPILHAAFVLRDEGRVHRPLFHADVRKAVRIAHGGDTWREPPYFVPRTSVEVDNFLQAQTGPVSVDVETDGVDPWTCGLRRVGIGTDAGVMIYSPLSVKGHKMLPDHEIAAQSRAIAAYVGRAPKLNLHNGIAFDSVVMWRHQMPLNDGGIFDTLVGHQVGYTSELPHRLDFLGSMYTDAPFWKNDVKHSELKDDAILDRYLSFDIAVTHLAAPYVEANLKQSGQEHIYTLDAELFRIGRSMAMLGLHIDREKQFTFAKEYQDKADRLTAEFKEQAGSDVNPNSVKQVKELLYHTLGLPALDEHITESGEPSTDEPTLLDLLGMGLDKRATKVIHALLGVREAEKILGTNTGHIVDGQIVGGPPLHGDGRLRTTWRPGKTSGRWGSSDPVNCFSGDTEVLTPDGWVRFDALPRGVKIAQWDAGRVEFVCPTAYVEKDADELVHVKLTHVDLLVTPDHRCMLRSKQTRKLRVFPAEKFPCTQYWEQVHAGVYAGGLLDFGDPMLRLLVAVQADGTYDKGDRVCFSFRKTRKADRLRMLLDGVSARYQYKERKNGLHHFEVRGDVANTCRRVLGNAKALGPWVLELTRSQLDVLCEEVFFWDGSWTRKNCYSSSVKQNADYVQAAFLLSGFRARIREYQNTTPNAKVNYQVDVTRRDWSLTSNRKRLPAEGQRVYCVSVPSSYILVRRNGTACVTGQCQNIPNKLRAMFTPAPGNVFVAADMSAVELRKIALLAGDEPLIEAFKAFDEGRGPDVHIYNACNVFKCTPEQVTKEIRDFIKRYAYATAYDAQPPTIYRTLSMLRDENLNPKFPHITLAEVERVFALWWQLHPAIPAWKKRLLQGWRSRGFIETAYHKRRRFFIGGENAAEMGNFPVQGGCADMQNEAIRGVVQLYPYDFARHRGLVINGHDQIVVECGADEAERVKQIIELCMQKKIGPMLFPAVARAGASWKDVS